jgi:hypothetical protein
MQQPELRPLGVVEAVDVSLRLYLGNAAALLGIVAVAIVPVYIVFNLILISIVPADAVVDGNQIVFPTQADINTFNLALLGFVLLSALAAMLATGAAFKAVAAAYLGHQPSIGDSLRFAGKRLHSLVWLSIIYVLILLVGFVLLIVPGIYLMVALSVAVPVLIFEGSKGRMALERSRALVKDRWWPTFGTYALGLLLLPFLIGLALGLIFNLIVPSEMSVTTFLFLRGTQEALIDLIAAPLQAAVLTVVYFDLRVRKEGLDRQLLTQRVGDGGPRPQDDQGHSPFS